MADMEYDDGGADNRRSAAARSGGKQKGRGHTERDTSDERYRNVVHKELDSNAGPGPLKSVEGWVVFISGVNEEAREEDVHEVRRNIALWEMFLISCQKICMLCCQVLC